MKKDKSRIEVGEILDFQVIEFNRETKRIVLSHLKLFQNEIEKERSEKNKEKVEMKKKVKKMRDDAEKSKSTLGDIDALSSLKGKMDE